MSKKVMCFGAFDLFHKGHKYFLKESQKHGDKLLIIVARDKSIKSIKKFNPQYLEIERKKEIEKHFPEAMVELGDERDFYMPLKNYNPDVICLGYDQRANIDEIKKHCPEVEIIRIKSHYPEQYKSSILKKKLRSNTNSK
ncbi:adenylyltransferase/cytidyltransferase family protein [Candidatus Peregrinibacteria bacterium]|jgi:FAD synthetase|nr:adenylyltransferase/cytidyltransferase family protein [Candidatus Peregrinibacteria bacterium]